MNELKRIVFSSLTLLFICLFFLTLSAWAQSNGVWRGISNEGGDVSFDVTGNGVEEFLIYAYLTGGSAGSGWLWLGVGYAMPISGNSFSTSHSLFDVTGTFTSSTTSTGTYNYHDPYLGYSSGTWTANFFADPEITLSPSNYNFGEQMSGTASDTVAFTLTNSQNGTATGSVSLTGTDADQFEITSGGGSFSLTHGQSKDIYVRFAPTSEDSKTATLMVDGDSPCNDASASLTGTGTYPILSVSPTYQNVPADIGSTTFTVTNEGSGTMSWTAERDPADTWITITSGSSGTDSGTITVHYDANYGDARIGTINVTADNAVNSPQTIELRQAEGVPDILLAPSSHDFGDQMAGTATGMVTFALTNTEGGTATGSVYLTGTNADQFEITSGGGSFSLSHGQSKDIYVRFVPTSTGLKTTTLMVDGDLPSNDASASLEGTGTRPEWKLTASDGAISDNFGFSASISGDYAIVGAYKDNDNGFASGSAYIFERTGSGWIQLAKLTASDGALSDYFGFSASMSGDYAIVGVYFDDDNGAESGSAYIFEKPAGGWVDMTETAKLTASDGASSDYFGFSASISGDYAIVGAKGDDDNGSASGSAYIFEKPVGGWVDMTETAKLRASDGALSDNFGRAVSISGNYAIVGAYLDNDNWIDSGSAYIFEKPVGGWVDMTETAKLRASDGGYQDYFGDAVSISGDYVIVGAARDWTWTGSAYIFEKPIGGWINMTETAKLTASDRESYDKFGGAVSIFGDYAIVGAAGDGSSGSAYIFEKPAGGWVDMTETAKLRASDGAASDSFGVSVGISRNYAIVGAYWDDDNGDSSGSAYIYYIGNFPPTISYINDQITNENIPSDAINFTISDSETLPEDLILTGISSNTTLVPNENIVLGGTGVNRIITITPAPNETGTTTITVTLSDGIDTVSDSFLLTVIVAPDTDGDGLPDSLEDGHCTDSNDADTDDDGISDGDEDANHNGLIDTGETDPCNLDTDADGIQDGTELGYTLAGVGPDTDTNIFQPDLDPPTTTDPLDADSDNDGLLDGEEDTNQNGRVDLGETDPTIFDVKKVNAIPWILLLLFD